VNCYNKSYTKNEKKGLIKFVVDNYTLPLPPNSVSKSSLPNTTQVDPRFNPIPLRSLSLSLSLYLKSSNSYLGVPTRYL